MRLNLISMTMLALSGLEAIKGADASNSTHTPTERTHSPSVKTHSPTRKTSSPTVKPSLLPTTSLPTLQPSEMPTASPSATPSATPSAAPVTATPSMSPSVMPTSSAPSTAPSKAPSHAPTQRPWDPSSIEMGMVPGYLPIKGGVQLDGQLDNGCDFQAKVTGASFAEFSSDNCPPCSIGLSLIPTAAPTTPRRTAAPLSHRRSPTKAKAPTPKKPRVTKGPTPEPTLQPTPQPTHARHTHTPTRPTHPPAQRGHRPRPTCPPTSVRQSQMANNGKKAAKLRKKFAAIADARGTPVTFQFGLNAYVKEQTNIFGKFSNGCPAMAQLNPNGSGILYLDYRCSYTCAPTRPPMPTPQPVRIPAPHHHVITQQPTTPEPTTHEPTHKPTHRPTHKPTPHPTPRPECGCDGRRLSEEISSWLSWGATSLSDMLGISSRSNEIRSEVTSTEVVIANRTRRNSTALRG